jgi:hypothetical protein
LIPQEYATAIPYLLLIRLPTCTSFLPSVRLPRFPRRSLPASLAAARATTLGSSPKQPFLARLTCIANLIKLIN